MALTVTRGTLKTFLRANYFDKLDTIATARTERCIEDGLRMVGRAREWAHQISDAPVNAIAPYSTGTVSVSNGSTSVTGSGTVFPSNVVTANAYIEFNGEKNWYQIEARGGDTALTLKDAYSNRDGTALSGATYTIVYPLYELPANFRRHLSLLDVATNNCLAWADVPTLWEAHSARAGTSAPYAYGVTIKRHDPNTKALLLYPAPASIEKYRLVYVRHSGWYSSATPETSTWAMKASSDAVYVDWPDEKLDILYAAILLKLYEEVSPERVAGAYTHYYQLLAEAQADDAENAQIRTLGSGRVSRRPGHRYEIGM